MEFEWVLSKYVAVTPMEQLGVNQMTTTETTNNETETYTVTETYTSDETTVVVTETTEYVDEPDFPDVNEGLTIRVKILKDLADAPDDLYFDYYDETQESLFDEYFDIIYSEGTEEEMRWFIPLEILITPNQLTWDNGTSVNLFRHQYEEYKNYEEESSSEYSDEDDYYSSTSSYDLRDGLAIQKNSFTEGNYTSMVEFRYDIDTGLLVYVYANVEEHDYEVELEIKLSQSTGIGINEIKGDPDPTLDVPISAIFVYTLLAVPIVINKIKKRY
jgi:hypothetical protein